ncbi:S1 RNA-binding domain-containing protein [Parasediminibacterium sp. JCM 36343]|uniref:CvfB family protein n=1 Tax=Parasediminibacterium sp. JCM 36343 TaxID=3374279 RepID=UPI00397823D1
MDIKIGNYNLLKVLRIMEFGVYMDDGGKGILLPTRWVPANTKIGNEIEVFIGHDNEDRLIATTLKSKAVVGDIAFLKVRTVTPIGAFLDMGLMKDLFVPRSQQISEMAVGNAYFVQVYIDERTNRLAGTERFEARLQNEPLTVTELEEVSLQVYRKTEIGYAVIVNNAHLGLIHLNEVYRPIAVGDTYKGYIKKIHPDTHKLDVVLGKPGNQRVESETEKILRLLQESKGKLPYNDKTNPETIYAVFGMSKKTFKMALGNLYKQKKIQFTDEGVALVN